ncbi:MAG: serine kinase [Pararhodobacter sp.]|nr:serine kinase [Pararhodobacter sp.]
MHATAVAFGPHAGVLILGASGTGKSQLGLALIGEGAQLVSDDQVLVTALDGALFARAPRPIAGLIEARGIGILRMACRRLTRIALIVDLAEARAPRRARLPDPQTRGLAGVTLPCLSGTPDTPCARAISHYISGMRHGGATQDA